MTGNSEVNEAPANVGSDRESGVENPPSQPDQNVPLEVPGQPETPQKNIPEKA